MNALILHYLGAGQLEAIILGLQPRSDEYLQWVKNALKFIFLPSLESARFKK
jgi:hypothetical protein